MLKLTKDEYKAIDRVVKKYRTMSQDKPVIYTSKQINKMLKNYISLDENYIKKTSKTLNEIRNIVKQYSVHKPKQVITINLFQLKMIMKNLIKTG